MSAPTLTIQKPVPTRPRGSTDLPAGLGIYTDETSSDDDDQSLARPNSGATYGSDFAKHRSYASSSATLLPVNSSSGQPQPFSSDETSTDAAERRPRVRRSGSASSTVSEESTDEEVMPLLRGARRENVSNAMKHKNEPSAHGHRFGCVTPISFILVSRMLLVPLICMPAILFHPETLSPILTTDPTFPLALVLINAAPTAINLAQLCQVKGFFEKPMAKVLFWSYCVFGIPSVLGWSLIGLWAAGRE
ncbi:hypothetical protein BGW38_003695 [Lunasporangiospora selenospora]|uniref:Uncharacterized protein n=1 Tax=Lunasporangiospora selenospora TaxID=979761 RepID=A0A9P6FQB2_9FUNG|nr:hypothetical protein BGW38_003695 [Lunasporangiospora selenospora]